MTSPYRNELDALRERKESLEQEIARLREQTDQLEALRSREQELQRELASVAQKLGPNATRRSLPMLDQVRVATPCNASWDEMLGDERVRFCMSCEKNVYNLSAMARDDAERLLQERVGKDLCVRFYQRADGTVLTEDCPVGVKKKRRKKIALAVAGAGAMAFAATSMLTRGGPCATTGMMVVQGEMPVEPESTMGKFIETPTPPATPTGWRTGDWAGPSEPTPAPQVMGTVAPPAPPPPPAHPPAKMGRPVMPKTTR
jgi:hypothetical protein